MYLPEIFYDSFHVSGRFLRLDGVGETDLLHKTWKDKLGLHTEQIYICFLFKVLSRIFVIRVDSKRMEEISLDVVKTSVNVQGLKWCISTQLRPLQFTVNYLSVHLEQSIVCPRPPLSQPALSSFDIDHLILTAWKQLLNRL